MNTPNENRDNKYLTYIFKWYKSLKQNSTLCNVFASKKKMPPNKPKKKKNLSPNKRIKIPYSNVIEQAHKFS